MSSQKVLVAGSGKSGIAAAKLLLAMGGEVVLYDGNDKLDPDKIKENFDEDAKLTVVLGELTRPDLLGVELSIILSLIHISMAKPIKTLSKATFFRCWV